MRGRATEARPWTTCVLVFALFLGQIAHASSSALPARVQAQLLAKAAEYDRNQATRPGTHLILLAVRAGDPESLSQAKSLAQEMAAVERIAGMPHREELLVVNRGLEAAHDIRARDAAIVYFSSGLEDEIAVIAEALSGTTVLTIGGSAGYAERGVVLGFETVSGHVELVVNLAQSRKQNVEFRSAFLAFVKVIR